MNDWRVRIVRFALFFIPKANPDNEPQYPKVKSWALELSEDKLPQREVGLSDSGQALFCAPNDRNTGFWTDMAIRKFEPTELEPMLAEEFEALWQSANARSPKT